MHDAERLSDDRLREWCLAVVRFLSSVAMDPHLYFEQKLAADIATADGRDELRRIFSQLVGWVDAMGLTAEQTRRLDESLAAAGLPRFSSASDGSPGRLIG